MKAWLAQRSPRERRILQAGAIGVILLLLYVGIWQPLGRSHARLSGDVSKDREELAWMRTAAMEVRLLKNRASSPSGDTRSLLARVSTELRSDKITTSRVQPEGDDRLRLSVNSVGFTRLLTALDRLQAKYGISVLEAAIEPVSESPGLVKAQLQLARTQQ